MTGVGEIFPDAQSTSLKNQCQMGILLFLTDVGLIGTFKVNPVVGNYDQDNYHKDSHYAEYVMMEVP
jgi:hypothetical protein